MLIKFSVFIFFLGLVTDIFSIYDVGGISITVQLLSFGVIVLASISQYRWQVDRLVVLFLLMLFYGLAVALIYNIDQSTLTSVVQFCFLVFVYHFFFNVAKFDSVFVSKVALSFLLVVVFFSYYQFFARVFEFPYQSLMITNQQFHTIDGFQRGVGGISPEPYNTRIASLFSEPSNAGRAIVIFYVLALPVLNNYRKTLLSVLVAPALLMTYSFGAVAIAIFSLLVLYPFWSFFTFLLMAGGTALLLNLLVLQGTEFLSYLPLSMQLKFESIRTLSLFENSDRFRFFPSYIEQTGDVWGVGYGIGNVDIVANNIVISSQLINVLYEYGIVGLLIIFFIYATTFFRIKNQKNIVKYLFVFQVVSLLWKPQLYDFLGVFLVGYLNGIAKSKT